MTIDSDKMASLLTERRNPNSMDIDCKSTREILQIIHHEDYKAFQSVDSQLENIEKVTDYVVEAFYHDGRLFYVGAGTSGRLGVLDAAECPPTFSSDPEQVQGIIAGGWDALRRAVEKAEDFPVDGAKEIQKREVGRSDVVIGIAASSTTPFVVGALKEAHKRGAKTAFITCNPNQNTFPEADITITLLVGPEVITGSTRMKAATATKLVLNMITTTAMIRIGKVYQNLMVDLTATNQKLEDRSRRIIVLLTGLSYEQADELVKQAKGRLKTALVMHYCHCDAQQAERMINQHEGRIQDIIPQNKR